MPKTIVTITPTSIREDSRALKIAASITRFGYKSVVVDEKKLEITANSDHTDLSKSLRQKYLKYAPKLLVDLINLFFILYNLNVRKWKHIPRADLYYLHAPHQFPVVYSKCIIHRSRFIYDAHDFYPVANTNFFLKTIERHCVRRASCVITVSSGIADLIQDFFHRQAMVVMNCHDRRIEKATSVSIKDKLMLNNRDFLIVHTGQAKEGQAVEEVAKSLKKLPDYVHVAFIGKNTNRYAKTVIKEGLRNRMHMLPSVEPENVVPYIRSADAAIIPYYSYSKNFEYCLPNGFFQSIAANLPTIYPELPEIVRIADRFGIGIPINPKSVVSIQNAITKMISDSASTQQMKLNLAKAYHTLNWANEERLLQKQIATVMDH